MLFNSTEFLLGFLPLFFIFYYFTPMKYRALTLLAGSLLFYACGEPVYVCLLVLSALLNYLAAGHIWKGGRGKRGRGGQRHRWVYALAVSANVLTLVFFKYVSPWTMPLGISFYTFQALSYLTDVYRGELRAERSFIRTAAYISMFPQIASGPITRYGEVAREMRMPRMRAEDFDAGLKTFVCGLSCKVLLADRLAVLWHEIQTTGFVSISTPLAWMGAVGFSLRIYFDFYGYSLMAAGLGRILGFTLPENFRLPYMADSVREFYRRWHMSLKNWFQRYVYIPLGGSRKGRLLTVRNLFVVWVLTALWHGGSLNFLIWGMSLFLLIAGERILPAGRQFWGRRALGRLYVWFVIPLTWMCFAISDLRELGIYFGRLFGWTEGIAMYSGDFLKALSGYGIYFAAGFFFCTSFAERLCKKYRDSLPGMLLLAVLFWLCIRHIQLEGNNPFMYLRF